MFFLLDSFLFPQSLNTDSATSPLDGLPLVRFNEARLGTSQGPLVSSAIRLSFVVLTLVEPCSLSFLQSCSRLRCLLCLALELLRDSSAPDGRTLRFHPDGGQHIDRLVLAVVLHCHRALRRCSLRVTSFSSSLAPESQRDTQKKQHRRVLRSVLELREIVATAFKRSHKLLASSVSTEAFNEMTTSLRQPKSNSREDVALEFLSSSWVKSYHGTVIRNGLHIPEQISIPAPPTRNMLRRNPLLGEGINALDELAKECTKIISDFDSVVSTCFEEYLDEQRKWAETDAVRDLEYDGDLTWKRLYDRHQVDQTDTSKVLHTRRSGADARWRVIYSKVVTPWRNENYWKLGKNTDQLGRRTLLIPNPEFHNHKDACYDTTAGNREALSNSSNLKKGLSDVMRRNADAFVRTYSVDEHDYRDDESSSLPFVSEEDSTGGSATTDSESIHDVQEVIENLPHEDEDEWDKIDSEEIKSIDANGKSDLWARAFIWAESETVVARFEPVVIVSLQTFVEGKVLLTTHGLYFRQLGEEMNVMTKEPVAAGEAGKDRRWRLTRLTEIHGRRYMLRPQAVELFFSDSHELLLNFPSGFKERDRFYAKLRNSCRVSATFSSSIQCS